MAGLCQSLCACGPMATPKVERRRISLLDGLPNSRTILHSKGATLRADPRRSEGANHGLPHR